jgi:hypothetical protein
MAQTKMLVNQENQLEEVVDNSFNPNGFAEVYDKWAEKQPKQKIKRLEEAVDFLNSEQGFYFQKSWLYETILKMSEEASMTLLNNIIADESHVLINIKKKNYHDTLKGLVSFIHFGVLDTIDSMDAESDFIDDVVAWFGKDKLPFAIVSKMIINKHFHKKWNIEDESNK